MNMMLSHKSVRLVTIANWPEDTQIVQTKSGFNVNHNLDILRSGLHLTQRLQNQLLVQVSPKLLWCVIVMPPVLFWPCNFSTGFRESIAEKVIDFGALWFQQVNAVPVKSFSQTTRRKSFVIRFNTARLIHSFFAVVHKRIRRTSRLRLGVSAKA